MGNDLNYNKENPQVVRDFVADTEDKIRELHQAIRDAKTMSFGRDKWYEFVERHKATDRQYFLSKVKEMVKDWGELANEFALSSRGRKSEYPVIRRFNVLAGRTKRMMEML